MMIEKKSDSNKKTRARRKRTPKKIQFTEISETQREMAKIYSESWDALYCKLAPWKQKALDNNNDSGVAKEFAHQVSKHAEKKIYNLLNAK